MRQHAFYKDTCCMHYKTPGYLLLVSSAAATNKQHHVRCTTLEAIVPVDAAAAELNHQCCCWAPQSWEGTHCCSCLRILLLLLLLLCSKPGTAHSVSCCCCLVALGNCIPVDQLVNKGGHVVGPAASSSSQQQQQARCQACQKPQLERGKTSQACPPCDWPELASMLTLEAAAAAAMLPNTCSCVAGMHRGSSQSHGYHCCQTAPKPISYTPVQTASMNGQLCPAFQAGPSPPVLHVQVVGMLPHIHGEDGCAPLCNGGDCVGCLLHSQLACLVRHQPGPAGTKLGGTCSSSSSTCTRGHPKSSRRRVRAVSSCLHTRCKTGSLPAATPCLCSSC